MMASLAYMPMFMAGAILASTAYVRVEIHRYALVILEDLVQSEAQQILQSFLRGSLH